jgi:hypothetical protein
MSTKGIMLAVGLLILLFAGPLGFVLSGFLPGHLDSPLSFEETSWKQDTAAAFTGKSYEQRYLARRDRMVLDLLRQHHFVGLARSEVTRLLGEADYSRSYPFPEYDLIYWLGPDDRGPFGHLDSKWLVMKCDTNNLVTSCHATFD